MRRFNITLALLLCGGLLICPPLAAQQQDLAIEQAQLSEKYQRLETLALRIAELVAEENPDRAQQLRAAIAKGRDLALRDRFQAVVNLLEQESYAAARSNQGELATQLQTLLSVLMADPAEARREAEQRLLADALKQVQKLQREQRTLRAEMLDRPTPASADAQSQLVDETAELQQALLDPQLAPPSSPEGGKSPASPKQRAASRLAQAQQAMRQAAEQLSESGEAAEAAQSQVEAEQQLSKTQQELEEALRQIREEESMRQLTQLVTRIRRMLGEQAEINRLTIELQQSHGDQPSRAKRSAAAGLAQREQQLQSAADAAIRLLQDDGSSVAFAEVLDQVAEDIHTVALRLQEGKTAGLTQSIQADIVQALEDAVQALDQQLASKQEQQAASGESMSGQPQESALVDKLAELRMLKAMQQRILSRTRKYQAMWDAGEIEVGEFEKALQAIALRQSRAVQAARSLAEQP